MRVFIHLYSLSHSRLVLGGNKGRGMREKKGREWEEREEKGGGEEEEEREDDEEDKEIEER